MMPDVPSPAPRRGMGGEPRQREEAQYPQERENEEKEDASPFHKPPNLRMPRRHRGPPCQLGKPRLSLSVTVSPRNWSSRAMIVRVPSGPTDRDPMPLTFSPPWMSLPKHQEGLISTVTVVFCPLSSTRTTRHGAAT